MRKMFAAIYRLLPESARVYIYRRYICTPIVAHKRLRISADDEGYTLTSSDQLKSIYVHIPKCAGISVSKSLFGTMGGGHLRVKDYQKIYTANEFASFFKFAFVRNPWDRLASSYFFLKTGGMNRNDKLFSDRHLSRFESFEHFVTTWVNRKNIMRYIHFQPQVRFLCARDNSISIDFIGFFENLRCDFLYICERIGVKADLLFLNKTQVEREDYRTQYTEKMIRIVSDVYAEDISLLGYTFDNSSIPQQLASREKVLVRSCG